MKDAELSYGLDLLADEVEPTAVDVYDVIAKAKARTRNRRATMPTALATVTVAGAMIATIGLSDPASGPPVGGRPTITSTPMPAQTPEVHDNHMVLLTQQLKEVWPTIVPTGVTTERTRATGGPEVGALEFVGFLVSKAANLIVYRANARLSDSLGEVEISIDFGPPQPNPSFGHMQICRPDYGCSTHDLEDGTRVRMQTGPASEFVGEPNDGTHRTMEAVRPDGSTLLVIEQNITVDGSSTQTRPSLVLDTEALLRLATELSYS